MGSTSSMSTSSSSQATTSSSSMSPSSSTQAGTTSSAPASSSTVTIATPITPSASRDPTSSSASTSISTSVAPGFTPSPSPVSSYQDRVLLAHNVHRANHSAADLTYSNELANVAQQIASSCVYGQNIAAGLTADEVTDVITNLWYNNEVNAYSPYYGQANPGGNFADYGHFTQVVWQGTTVVGCATQDCSAGGLANVGPNVPPYFTVCNYYEAGNYGGEYADNIDAPLGFPTVTGDYGVADSVNV